jgi:hypothetical protein
MKVLRNRIVIPVKTHKTLLGVLRRAAPSRQFFECTANPEHRFRGLKYRKNMRCPREGCPGVLRPHDYAKKVYKAQIKNTENGLKKITINRRPAK